MILEVNWTYYSFQIISCTAKELERLEELVTCSEWKWSNRKRVNISVCYMHNYTFIPIGFYKQVLALQKEGYVVEIRNFDSLCYAKPIDRDSLLEWVIEQDFKYPIPRWYQQKALYFLLKFKQIRVEVATGGGKSFIIAMYTRFLLEHEIPEGGKVLIITIRQQLVDQMIDDIYDYKKDKFCTFQAVYAGTEEVENANVIVGTYQSMCNWDEEKFKDIKAVVIDEAHSGVIASIKDNILPKIRKWGCQRFVGLSGTLPEEGTIDNLHLTAYTGPISMKVTAKELMDEGSIAKLKIHCINIEYGLNKTKHYFHADEVIGGGPKRLAFEKAFLHDIPERNEFISNVCERFVGNQVILVESVEYAKFLVQYLSDTTSKQVRLIYGGVKKSKRKEIIEEIKVEGDSTILVATYETMSTGVSINNIMAVHFPDGGKSDKRIRQSIGRGLRLHPKKDFLKVFDYIDIFRRFNGTKENDYEDKWPGPYQNLFRIHGNARKKIYQMQKFEYKETTYKID